MKFKYYIFSLKRNFFALILIVFTFCLFIFSKSNLDSARNSLILWAKFVVPSLFPFFVLSELMSHTNIISILGRLLTPIIRPLFKVPGISSFAIILGYLSGYPVGAKIVSELRNKKMVTQEEGNRLLAFSNNSGPLFIVATVGIGLFGNITIGFLLLITHILASLSVGILLGLFSNQEDDLQLNKKNQTPNNNNSIYTLSSSPLSLSNLGELLSNAVLSSINTLLLIGGFIVLFNVIISIFITSGLLSFILKVLSPICIYFKIDVHFIEASIIGLLEVTEGINRISNIHIKNISINILFSSFILGFGGFSVLLQILSVIRKTDLSIRFYFIGKLLQAVISTFYTYIAIIFIPALNLDLNNNLHFDIIPFIFFFLILNTLLNFLFKQRKKIAA